MFLNNNDAFNRFPLEWQVLNASLSNKNDKQKINILMSNNIRQKRLKILWISWCVYYHYYGPNQVDDDDDDDDDDECINILQESSILFV